MKRLFLGLAFLLLCAVLWPADRASADNYCGSPIGYNNGTCGGAGTSGWRQMHTDGCVSCQFSLCHNCNCPSCGPANGGTFASAPSTGLCSGFGAVEASSVNGSGPWTWTCGYAINSYKVNCGANISAPAPVNGVCGSADGGVFTSQPVANLCSAGTPSAVSGTGPWTWVCNGLNGGSSSGTCSANRLLIQSSCTLAFQAGDWVLENQLSNLNLSVANATGPAVCSCDWSGAPSMTSSGVYPVGPFGSVGTRSCSCSVPSETGTPGTCNDSIESVVPIDGVCGANEKVYSSDDLDWSGAAAASFCAAGNPPAVLPAYPALGAAASWICSGLYTGANGSCTAPRYVCNVPIANGLLCADDNKQLSGNTDAQAVASCSDPAGSDPKCEYTCNPYSHLDSGSCPLNDCKLGNLDVLSATLCSGDDSQILVDDMPSSLVEYGACSDPQKCEYYCNQYYHKAGDGLSCIPYECTGTSFANADYCAGDSGQLEEDTPKTLVVSESACSAAKCQMHCNQSHFFQKGACVPYQCGGSIPKDGYACPGSESGLTDHYDWTYAGSGSVSCSGQKCEYYHASGTVNAWQEVNPAQ